MNHQGIASDASSLDSAIKQATSDTTASAAFSEDEGSAILSAIHLKVAIEQ